MSDWPLTICLPHGLALGGVTTWAVQLAERLADRGQRTRLVLHASDEPCPPGLAPGPAVEQVVAPPLDAEHFSDCVACYRDLTPTVLAPNLVAESYAVAAALALTQPDQLRVVAWNHSDNPYEAAFLRWYEPIIHRYAAVSRHCADALQAALAWRRADIALLPYGVPDPGPIERPPLAGRPIRLLYAGRIEQANKRVFDLIELADRLRAAGVAFELRFVGDGPVTEELRGAIAARGGTDVRWLPACGFRDMAGHWAWADAFVLASTFEGFSVAMLEAMLAGCVPLVSRVSSGVADIVTDSVTGWTFPVGNVEALCTAVRATIGDPARTRRIGAQARAAAGRICNYDAYLGTVAGLLDDLVALPPRSWPAERAVAMQAAAGDPTVPSDAAVRMRTVLRRLATTGRGPIALYGAGRHTLALAGELAHSPTPIVALIDDAAVGRERCLWNWPVVTLEAALARGVRAIVISSYLHAETLLARARTAVGAADVEVVALYGETSTSPAPAAASRERQRSAAG